MLTLIILALFASGCGEKNLSAEEVATQIMDKQNSTQDYSYTVQATYYIEGKAKESEIKSMFKKPNKIKSITTESGKENQTIVVSDGEFIWNYHPETNEVVKTKLSGIPEPTQNDYINVIDKFLNSTNVTLLGMEDIDGKTTYLLETTPKEASEASQEASQPIYRLIGRAKIWVDKETWMPLRSEIYDHAGNLTMKFEIRDLKVNSGIPDSEFKFEIPNGAKIVEQKNIKSSELELFSLEEARKKASFKILTPEYLPEGYTFYSSTIENNSRFSPTDHISERVHLMYISLTGPAIIIIETVYDNQSSGAKVMHDGEDIKVNGTEGKYVSIGDRKILEWKLGNVSLLLGTCLEKDEMLKIAESISAV